MKMYALIEWPESQLYMEEPWFRDEAVLADHPDIGSSAYFIPTDRLYGCEPDDLTYER